MKNFTYVDKEFPSGLDESIEQHYPNPRYKKINAKDLAQLLKNSLKSIDKLRSSVNETIDKLGMKDAVVNGNVDELLNIEKEIVNISNKFNNNIRSLK